MSMRRLGVITVSFDDLRPLEATTTGRPVLADVRDVLFVVDTINTRPGVSGQLWLDEVNAGTLRRSTTYAR